MAGGYLTGSNRILDRTAVNLYNLALKQYLPGGGYGAGMEESLNQGRTQTVAGGMQALINSGMANTTMPAGLAKKYESEVAVPERLNSESMRAQALAGIYSQVAGAEVGGTQNQTNRNLQAELAGKQSSSQQAMASMRNQLGYAQLSAQQTASTNRLAMDKYIANLRASTSKPKIDTGGYGGGSGYNLPSSMNGSNSGTYSGTTMAQGYGPYGPGTYKGAGLNY